METWDALQKDVEMYLAKRPGKTAVSCWLLTEKQGFSIGGFFVKFWGAKVSMHSWRGHALKIVRVLFRCVC